MENPEEILSDIETIQEKERPFGYDTIYQSLEAMRDCLMQNNIGLLGVVLGRLIQRLEDNKDFFNEE